MSFETYYNDKIKPFCNEYENSECYTTFDGKKMHFLSYFNKEAKANILILHGFTEWAKKFDEMAYRFFEEGYNVFIPDLRGHGLSYKDDAPKYGVNSFGFDYYENDIKSFINIVIKNSNALPTYCYTHSLGGNIALLSLIDKKVSFDKLVLSSPMICGNMGMPVGVAKVVAKTLVSLGKGNMPAPGKCVFDPNKDNADATSIERGRFALKQKVENENYQTCGPTFNWVLHSIYAKEKLLNVENIKNINSKILVVKPEKDFQLLEKPQDKFIDLCKSSGIDINVINTKNTHHEIYQSSNEELNKYIQSILEFFK